MIPVGHPYRAAGPIDLRLTLSTLILGSVTAIVSALAVWLWELSPIPTLVILTPILQGLLIGLLLRFMIGRLNLRNPKLLGLIGVACGLTSVALVHYAHYLHLLDQVTQEYRTLAETDKNLTAEQKAAILAATEKDSGELGNALLVERTGRGGLIGSLILRSQVGITLKNTPLTGTGVYILWAVEAGFVVLAAASMATSRAGEPFCEDCETWCQSENGQLALVGEAAGPLVEAVRVDDTARVVTLRDHPPETAGDTATWPILHSCPGCDQTFADISHKTVKTKRGKTEATTKTLLTRIRVSPEMVQVLRNVPAEPTPVPGAEVAG